MNETEYRLRLKGEIDIEAVIAATCGKTFTCTNYNKRQLCCSRSCGNRLGGIRRGETMAKRKIAMKGA